jgi:hypothetical protein
MPPRPSVQNGGIFARRSRGLTQMRTLKQEHTEATEMEKGVLLCALRALLFKTGGLPKMAWPMACGFSARFHPVGDMV